jgi:hypothetical protein
MVRASSQPSQTLSPLPPAPTRFMPSFQSPPPISGSPCSPVSAMQPSIPRAQCSNSEADTSETIGWKKASASVGPSSWPSRNGTISSSTAVSSALAI